MMTTMTMTTMVNRKIGIPIKYEIQFQCEQNCGLSQTFRLKQLTITVPGSVPFEWTHDLNNGSTVRRCVGDDVTLPWSYVTRGDVNVMAIFWFSDKNGTIASQFINRFMTSSDRVTYAPNAGVTISGLSADDVGEYGVHVKTYDDPGLRTQLVNVVVAGEKAAVVICFAPSSKFTRVVPLFSIVMQS